MRLRRTTFVLISVVASLLFIGSPAQGQTLTPKGAAEIDALLQRAIQQGTVPGVVAVVASKDQILYHHAFGLRDVRGKKPMQEDSIFRIASMTKPVTSSAIMLLVEQGKLRLDDPVSKYLPSFANRETVASFNETSGTLTTRKAASEVLIRHLLSHTSGLAYAFSNPTTAPLQQKTGKQPEDLPLLYDPRTRWTYSSSTKVLGWVVEKISGGSLDQFLTEHFIKPLSMVDTSYAVPAGKTDRVVTIQNRSTGALVETPNPAAISSPVAGDGGLNSTAADYIKFLQMFLNSGKSEGKTILSKHSIQAMTANQIGNVVVQTQPAALPNLTRPFPVGPSAGRDKFGFGFEITASNKENPNLRSAGSYTWAGIYNTHFWVDPKRGIAGVIMFQVLPFYDDSTMKVYQEFEEAIGRNLQRS
ncbi:MAG TPA: serine hydrolase domain-containing protein [Terriglobia bacterium]|nr:serine hydrolase domain-containing protein [Terriglobia bacterium]